MAFSAPKVMLVGAMWLLLLLITTSAWTSPMICSDRASHRYSGRLLMASGDVYSSSSSSTFESSDTPTDTHTNTMNNMRQRRQIQLNQGKEASILSRTVPISDTWNVTVWEWEKPAAVVETFWQVEHQGLSLTRQHSSNSHSNSQPAARALLDPFGLVSWPGAVVAAQELALFPPFIQHKRVLVLGAGVGIEAQAVAMLGAKSVMATDVHPTTLKLLQYGADQAGLSDTITTAIFDLFSTDPLPDCDLMVVADVLYNERLAAQVARRCLEARCSSKPPVILVSDSQRFVHQFEQDLNQGLRSMSPSQPRVAWEHRFLPEFTGSGVLIDGDQTYDVKARVLWIGL